MHSINIICLQVAWILVFWHQILVAEATEHIDRKSIVFDVKTPKVFYCSQEKQNGDLDKMIVKAKPLKKLCEYGGNPKPANSPSDCYNDVDETQFACEEKSRFEARLLLSAEDSTTKGIDDLDFILASETKKKTIKKKL